MMPLEILSRSEWCAKPPKEINNVGKAVDFVSMHHSNTPQCDTAATCGVLLRFILIHGQNVKSLSDIGYK